MEFSETARPSILPFLSIDNKSGKLSYCRVFFLLNFSVSLHPQKTAAAVVGENNFEKY